MKQVTIFWFRRDLRLNDNAGLFHALEAHSNVLPLFIFDTDILDKLEAKDDKRVEFIHRAIVGMKSILEQIGSSLVIRHGKPMQVWQELIQEYEIECVYTNRDWEPYARQRDASIADLLEAHNIGWKTFKDHVIFEGNEVLKDDGNPYTVFTPYSRKWKASLAEDTFEGFSSEHLQDNFIKVNALPDVSLKEIGFEPSDFDFPPANVEDEILENYSEKRNFPGIRSTSRLGVHFRFGTISIREYARRASRLSNAFLNELVWRDFYQMILWNFPYVVDQPFKPAYRFIEWRNNEEEFDRWCCGKTGYPIVDAGMRELNETGFMHNRVRMITASFLVKHLLIDWRWGEAYFAGKLLDFDLASNNGGWQWAAGCGTDAAPYFRIFNPYTQAKKFDKDLTYINKWVPELNELHYPEPVVEHKFARERCLKAYKTGLDKAKVS